MFAPVLILVSLFGSSQVLETQKDFEERLSRLYADSKVPGAMVRVARDGKKIYERAFGFADVDRQIPVLTKMPFEIGSLSKQFVAVAALILVNEGKLSLQSKIGNEIPEVPAKWRDATIEQILHHISGIPDYEEIATYDFYNLPRKTQDILSEASKKEPAFLPGEKFEYSNTGYFLISMVIERRSQRPMSEFLRTRLFEPAGMKSTYTDRFRGNTPVMTGYHSRTGKRVSQPPIAWSSTQGAGGIVSTLDDLMSWDQTLYTEKLLPKDLLSKIWTGTKLKDGKPSTYGFGWFTTSFRGQWELNHSGQTNGFTCIYRRYPNLKTSVWAVANTYDGEVFGLARTTAIRYIPELSYRLLVPSANLDAAVDGMNMKALRQVLFAEGEMDLLAPNMKSFATGTETAAVRKQVKEIYAQSAKFSLLRSLSRRRPAGDQVVDHLYRQQNGDKAQYWTLVMSDGKLISFFVEDE